MAGVLGALAVLLVGGGALALVGLGSADEPSDGSGPPPRSAEDGEGAAPFRPEATEGYGATEPTTPAPTTVDLMQGFVSDHYDALSDGDYADAYSMLDEESRQKITEEEWEDARAGLGASGDPSRIASATVEGPYASETQVPFTTNVRISYEDGASETVELGLVSEYVVDEAGDFRRHLTDGEVSSIEGSASTENTASVPPSSPEPTTFGLSPEGEDQVREAAEQYYYAVDYESWDTTYYNLDAESKALFTEEEWIAKNRWYAEIEGLELDSMEIDVSMDGEERAEVTVDRTFTDGTSITRDTVFVPVEEVKADYLAVQQALTEESTRKASPRTLEVARFVWEQRRRVGGKDLSYLDLMERWNKSRSDGGKFSDWRAFYTAFVRGKEAALPRYERSAGLLQQGVREGYGKDLFGTWASEVRAMF
ncbi:MAG: hypothetical protein M3534_04800 [Actinomycetota bacterium]|nr:hypothetical protein [Actinomycetota bacterium]